MASSALGVGVAGWQQQQQQVACLGRSGRLPAGRRQDGGLPAERRASAATPGRRRRCAQAATATAELGGAVVSVAVGAAVAAAAGFLYFRGGAKEALSEGLGVNKPRCSACSGSGVCPLCDGSGFVSKALSPEEAERARQREPTAARRYVAGLSTKWKYCSECSGGRICKACAGRGWVDA
eukprot:jgi/Chlat1/2303/Chrsp17S02596